MSVEIETSRAAEGAPHAGAAASSGPAALDGTMPLHGNGAAPGEPETQGRFGDEPRSGPRLGAAAADPAWQRICALTELHPDRGIAALIGMDQIAVFRLRNGRVFAIDQDDPYSGAFVMSRGLVGSRGGRPVVASPMYKQVFDLATGECLDPAGKEPVSIGIWPVRVLGSDVYVGRRENLS